LPELLGGDNNRSMTSGRRYKIHPAIGIARVGNAAPSDFFIGPERPGEVASGVEDVGTRVPPFKIAGKVKRQAARFRIWEYAEKDGIFTPEREVNARSADMVELTWTVHLANRKASFYKIHGLLGSTEIGQNVQNLRNPDVTNRDSLEIDPLARSITGTETRVEISQHTSETPQSERWPDPQPQPPIVSLGELRTDDAGRLIVIPAPGVASRRENAPDIDNFANNDGWFDDVSDGPVTARLRLRASDGTIVDHEVSGAWLLVAPPDFAPPVPQVVSLWDCLFDVAVRRLPLPLNDSGYLPGGELASLNEMAPDLRDSMRFFATYSPKFDEDIAPVLRAALAVTSVFKPAQYVHRSFGKGGIDADTWSSLSDPNRPNTLRKAIFRQLSDPADPLAGGMPRLFGDIYMGVKHSSTQRLKLTTTQYALMERWSRGEFVRSSLGPDSLLHPPVAEEITPHGLDRAPLLAAAGGAFFPGIEGSWMFRQPSIFEEPFRIKHEAASPLLFAKDAANPDRKDVPVGAGFFSRQMALPWLADFLECVWGGPDTPQLGWWPSQRPDFVYENVAAATDLDPMVPWHRATTGGERRDWPESNEESPSFDEMIEHWPKFGFVVMDRDGHLYETERPDTVP
jgi:hypothetical protein